MCVCVCACVTLRIFSRPRFRFYTPPGPRCFGFMPKASAESLPSFRTCALVSSCECVRESRRGFNTARCVAVLHIVPVRRRPGLVSLFSLSLKKSRGE